MTNAQPASSQPFLLIRNLVKAFDGVRAVNDISLAIDKGEIFALLGSSGCGKSTLLRMLAGFETPTAGTIELAGQDLVGVPPYERPVNMMFQSYALFPHLTVWDNVAFGLRRDGLPRAEVAERVEQMLALVQLGAYAKRKPHQLSGGQQQRVALARSLAKRPQLLLLDEPLGALDKKLREQTQMELVNIIEQVGVTCVMVTHDQDEAMSMATRIAVMSEGRILQVGAPGDIYETPNCRFVADFIGSVNMFDGHVRVDQPDHVIIETQECRHYVSHGISGTINMPVSVAVRPEKIALQRDLPGVEQRASAAEDGYNCVTGEIANVSYFGNETHYQVRLAQGGMLKVARTNAARHEEARMERGQRVVAWWDGSDIVVLTN
ncbi:polyamine ABC transporter ATP-binding protein [Massilia sp. P8910]|uniref:Spermidine/putrescine import ATP-binding protein PotA n=1 Tax=Massilia antarctica TaxID=2765360 RepID=A0AA49A8Y6_9BURK|nr:MULTISPECIES: polyamine ABC transporter ATP-binding protein [Massilia]CUI05631.1 Putrescine transport ATP-binding protein PotG (TC 3.A.1.11.2) [Janthinobacterium sp. CG23_2]MCE3603592.1 polyamine ABC transporter ATP-binding protein [Massilia antarctica]MCY0916011.1 polyamine ABC transporter ATP-binding protein [Massilia sp. H27-R4]QPI50854.1 polyamine ABC transporter ATP-binding protein [Massilia antarctica]CUU29417.1 Putrescine transport ATP-binding protein PotG (TC 3.A.1.11.2) [Janthinoba